MARSRIVRNGLANYELFAGGEQGPHIVLLAGCSTSALFVEYVLGLKDQYIAIAPTLPPDVDTIDGALDWLAQVLESFRIARAHVFGHSAGGYLAQELARRRPHLVRSLMLSGTCLPGQAHTRKVGRDLLFARYSPRPLLGLEFRSVFRRILKTSGSELSPQQRETLVDEMEYASRLPALRQFAISSAKLQMAYHHQILGEERWNGPTLLFETDNDAFTSQSEMAALRARYPQAGVTRFRNAGHLSVFSRANEYLLAMRQFLARDGYRLERGVT